MAEKEDKDKLACDQVTDDVLLDYRDGSLEEDVRDKVESHLSKCDSCRKRADEVKTLSTALRENAQLNEDVPVPELVDKEVSMAIDEVSRKSRGRGTALAQRPGLLTRMPPWVLPAAAWIVIAVIVGLLIFVRGGTYPTVPPALGEHEVMPGFQPEAAPGSGYSAQAVQLRRQLDMERGERLRHVRKLEEADARVQELVGTMESLQAEVADGQAELSTKDETIASLNRVLREKEEYVQEQETEAGRLGETLLHQDEKINELETTSEALRQELESLKEKEAGFDEGMARRDSELSESKELIAKLEGEKAALHEKLSIAGKLDKDKLSAVSDAMVIVNNLLAGGGKAGGKEKDVNGDGRVDVGDALQILNKAIESEGE